MIRGGYSDPGGALGRGPTSASLLASFGFGSVVKPDAHSRSELGNLKCCSGADLNSLLSCTHESRLDDDKAWLSHRQFAIS